MKPIAIFRHAEQEGPGHLADFLDEHSIPWRLIRIDAGDTLPVSASEVSGLVFMGGPMSVNDPLPWVVPVLALIREAVAHDIPVLGHCLGGQLMAKALGGVVERNPVKEIGWHAVAVADDPLAREWCGGLRGFDAFHWHGETFSLPSGATRILSSVHCLNQGFALGKHLGLQCHVEMTAGMVAEWCRIGAEEIEQGSGSPAVQSAEAILRETTAKLPALHAAARQLYQHWIRGLK
jgi:GMP synthase-like glutamine amidotransferase